MGIEKLCLGTVQFGLNYGINNKTGKPSKEQTFAMLDLAIKQGITCFDTAAAYGDAETLLGEFFRSRNLTGKVRIISKLLPNVIDHHEEPIDTIVKRELQGSLERLGVNCLDGYLLHTPGYFYNPQVLRGLKECQVQGLVKNIGVSIYETQHALDVVKSGAVQYIQVPYSIFDQRLNQTDFFAIARSNGITVFGRSAFLQGLFFMNDAEIPSHLAMSRRHFAKLDQLLKRHQLSRLEAAFLFSYTNPGLDYLVFGVDTPEQLREDLNLLGRRANDNAWLNDLKNSFADMEESIIFPSLWAKKGNQ